MTHRNAPIKTTVETLAEREQVIAVFVYQHTGSGHSCIASKAAEVNVRVWDDVAGGLVSTSIAAQVADGDHVLLRFGDAQVLRYRREGRYSCVVVMHPSATLTKSIHRSMGQLLRNLAKCEETGQAA